MQNPLALDATVRIANVGQAAMLYASGLSLREVCEHLNSKHPFSVSYQLERAGIPRCPWDPRTRCARHNLILSNEWLETIANRPRGATTRPSARWLKPSST